MPSERRLHPLSIPFWLGSQVRRAILPVFLGAASLSVYGVSWQLLALLGMVPLVGGSILRYITFRYHYGPSELVIKTGLFFRRERHVPYNRIQNLDAVQSVLHRVFGVVEVRIQTGGGSEPEAKMTVLPIGAVDELRARVFEGKSSEEGKKGGSLLEVDVGAEAAPVAAGAGATEAAAALVATGAAGPSEGETLLHLPPRELILYGLIQNRGMLVIAAGLGLLWEVGIMDRLMAWAFGGSAGGEGAIRGLIAEVGGGLAPGRISLGIGAVIGVLLFARLLSMAWALVRLHDYTVTRIGEDLRTTFGLLTQVAATIPLRRVQTVTIHEGPLHRLAKRVAVRVETAGGVGAQDGDPNRQWLAPLIRVARLPELLSEVVPELDMDMSAIVWEPVAPRALRRVTNRLALVAIIFAIPFFVAFGWWGFAALGPFLAAAVLYGSRYVKGLGWSVNEDTVLFRSGWLWRQISVARFAKIQAVTVRETPFDRRRSMARVRVDTAGGSATSRIIEIPYLPVATARTLGERLAAEAAQTAFRW